MSIMARTTFADSLLAANNILSSRMAGKIRYLDSRVDEQGKRHHNGILGRLSVL